MRPILLYLILLLASQFSWSQQKEQYQFSYSNAKLADVLSDIESKFDIKYSYIDSIIAPKNVTFQTKTYNLDQLNSEISQQTSLTIVQIDNRYYSVYKKETE